MYFPHAFVADVSWGAESGVLPSQAEVVYFVYGPLVHLACSKSPKKTHFIPGDSTMKLVVWLKLVLVDYTLWLCQNSY